MTEPPAGDNTPIRESITTPDTVETRLGTLEFFDGLPTPETADRLHDHLTFVRGVEAFLSGIPAASLEAMRDYPVCLLTDRDRCNETVTEVGPRPACWRRPASFR